MFNSKWLFKTSLFFLIGISIALPWNSGFGAETKFSGTGDGTNSVHLEAGLWFVTFDLTTPGGMLEGVDLDLKNSSGDVIQRIFSTAYVSDPISKILTAAIKVGVTGDYVLEVDTYTNYYTDWEVTIIAGSEVTPVDPPDDRYSFSGAGTQVSDLVHLEAGLWFVTFDLTTPNQFESVTVDLLNDSGTFVSRLFDTDYTSEAVSTTLTKTMDLSLSGKYVLQVYTHTEYYTDWDLEIYRLNAFPICNTVAAGSVSFNGSILNGNVNPNGSQTVVRFQYGTTSSYGSEINATPSLLSGSTFQTVNAQVSELVPNTTYHFRVFASNDTGSAYGRDMTFKTADVVTIYVSSDGDCGIKNPCYDSVQDAIDDASNGSVILVKQGTYPESIRLSSAKTLFVKGGYNSTYDQQTPNKTFIQGIGQTTIQAPSGSLKFEMLTIKAPQ